MHGWPQSSILLQLNVFNSLHSGELHIYLKACIGSDDLPLIIFPQNLQCLFNHVIKKRDISLLGILEFLKLLACFPDVVRGLLTLSTKSRSTWSASYPVAGKMFSCLFTKNISLFIFLRVIYLSWLETHHIFTIGIGTSYCIESTQNSFLIQFQKLI